MEEDAKQYNGHEQSTTQDGSPTIAPHTCDKVKENFVQLCKLKKRAHTAGTLDLRTAVLIGHRFCFHTSPRPPCGRPQSYITSLKTGELHNGTNSETYIISLTRNLIPNLEPNSVPVIVKASYQNREKKP